MNQKGFINIVVITLIVIVAGIVGYFILVREPSTQPVGQEQSTNEPTQQSQITTQDQPTSAPASSPAPTTGKTRSVEQKLSVVSDKYFSNLEALDQLTEKHPLIQQIIPADFTFTINKYTASLFSENGKIIPHTDIPNWQKIQQELKALNLTNQKIIQVHGKDVIIALLEWHSEDPVTKQFCTLDGSFCETEHQWFRVSVNGYEANIYREEGRTFTFDDGTKINILVADGDVDFMVKILKN